MHLNVTHKHARVHTSIDILTYEHCVKPAEFIRVLAAAGLHACALTGE